MMGKYKLDRKEREFIESTAIPVAIYQFIDKRVTTIALSDGFLRLFGFDSRKEAVFCMDHDMYRDAHPDDVARISEIAVRFAVEGGEYEAVYRNKSPKNDKYRIVHAHGYHVYPDGKTQLAVIWYTDEGDFSEDSEERVSMITRLYTDALHRESIERESSYDSLTGLPNIAYFFQLAEAGRDNLLDADRQPAMVFFDLNGMTWFNNKFGFAEGDKLLKEFSKLLVRYFSKENCGRFGQDHFLVYTDDDGLKEKLRDFFEELKTINNGRTLTVKVGIFLKLRDKTLDAGVACDRAKAAANSITDTSVSDYRYFDEEMHEAIMRQQYIKDNFERAMEEEWIKVYYQPIVRASNGKVCDEEALSRWIDPERGILRPDEFIPVLEESHLIYKLDLYVLGRVIKKIKRSMKEGLSIVPQSINLSRYDFESCDIVEQVRKMVDDAGISHDKITIEITESVIGSDFEFMKRQVERFHELGFNVWMDDFGSDYSSLSFLMNIPFDLIKLDMRFMRQFHESEKTKVIVTEFVRMALNLGVETIAEGVEDPEQAGFLQEIGCSKLQGYHYGRPIPADMIIDLLRKGMLTEYENPDEAVYYASIGKLNLYDVTQMGRGEDATLVQYFNTLPMAILESGPDGYEIIRSNKAFRDFKREVAASGSDDFTKAVRRCAESGNKLVIDRVLDNGYKVHTYLRRVAVNPVTGKAAVMIAVLSVADKGDENTGITYASIARSLSSDYFDLFYVNTETEEFVQYSTEAMYGDVDAERHGTNFFETARKDAVHVIYEEDLDRFLSAFTKDIVMRAIDRKGAFTLTYRQMVNGEPVYVSMKAVRLSNDADHIIIGVNNVDADMKHKEELETIREERKAYSIIKALAGNYMSFYTIDPKTWQYKKHNVSEEYNTLETPDSGKDFFEDVRREALRLIYSQDLGFFMSEFTRDRMTEELRKNGVYGIQYRLLVNGVPRYVRFKAAMTDDRENPMIAAGVVDDDTRVRREMRAEKRMSDTISFSRGELEARGRRFRSLVDMIAKPCAVLSVEKLPGGRYGDIRIVCANDAYIETMGGKYHDNMLYHELVPKDIKFEDFCYRAAVLGQPMHSYVETRGLGAWTDLQLMPLISDSEDVAYCQFIFDFTKGPDPERMSNVSAGTSEFVVQSCIKLLATDDLKSGVNSVLEDIRAIADASWGRIILVDRNRERVTPYSAVFGNGEKPEMHAADIVLPYDLVKTWEDLIGDSNNLIIKDERDMDALRAVNPEWADSLMSYGIKALVLIPLARNGEIFGYLYLINFDISKTVEIKEMLELIAFFLSGEISNRLLLEQMELMSYTDPLTGVNNRNAMLRRMNDFDCYCFGVLSIDLNGLKYTNDFYGHDAGDRLLVQAAEVLKKIFYKEDIFRTGGDEFIIMIPNISEVVFNRKLERLIADAEKNMDLSFSVGSFWSDGSVLPAVALKMADDRMYADKREYYRQHPDLKTR